MSINNLNTFGRSGNPILSPAGLIRFTVGHWSTMFDCGIDPSYLTSWKICAKRSSVKDDENPLTCFGTSAREPCEFANFRRNDGCKFVAVVHGSMEAVAILVSLHRVGSVPRIEAPPVDNTGTYATQQDDYQFKVLDKL